MRTIEEIKETICADFMRNESVAELFGFTPGDSFTSHFSKVSVIGILFYIFAVAAWALEKLFDTYKGEVDTRIEEIIPHRPRWYRDKVLAFMKGKTLIADTDRYDTEGMTEDAIAAARVVKHAVAVENRDASLLTIKVAGEKDGKRCRLDAETEAQLAAYIAENNLSWDDFPAFKWCREKGEGWYLPSIDELLNIGHNYSGGTRVQSSRQARNRFNNALKNNGGKRMDRLVYYFSSTEKDEKEAYTTHTGIEPPYVIEIPKYNKFLVRAVHKF